MPESKCVRKQLLRSGSLPLELSIDRTLWTMGKAQPAAHDAPPARVGSLRGERPHFRDRSGDRKVPLLALQEMAVRELSLQW